MPAHKKLVCIRGHELTDKNRGCRGRCRKCAVIYSSSTKRRMSRGDRREESRRYREKHKEAIRLYHRRYCLLKKYGLTPEEYQKLWEIQDGLCAICNKRDASFIDHNHITGCVRGLLCSQCNSGLGMFCDDGEILLRAERYLKLHE